ncbi:hypothetical protein Vretimale_782 [Volvox reticuliferus]|uniref:Uncharacterized protein n=1 Tax=Volvox reticuliferus TaxID=1737510 RepID=A0A8J4FYN6_9CHLO|nr:hypothetical protein Vretifemale_2099 [Volvox reticuliferus]GIL94553.1 hypothetical protein Vretimale_782 [Volvox reticuliferus]
MERHRSRVQAVQSDSFINDRVTAELLEPATSRPGHRRRLLLVQPIQMSLAVVALGSDRQSLVAMQYCGQERSQTYPRRTSVDVLSHAHTSNISPGRQICAGVSTAYTGGTCHLLASAGVDPLLGQTDAGYRQSNDNGHNPGPKSMSALWNPLSPQQLVYKPGSSSSGDSTNQSANLPSSTVCHYQQHQLPDLQPPSEHCGGVSWSGAARNFDILPGASRPQDPARSPPLPCGTIQTALPEAPACPASATSVEQLAPYSTLVQGGPMPDATAPYHQPLQPSSAPEVLSPPAAIASLPPAHSPQPRLSDERLRVRKGSKKDLARTGVYAAAYMYQFWAHGEEQQAGLEGHDGAPGEADVGPGSIGAASGGGDLPSPAAAAAAATVPTACAGSAGADPIEAVVAFTAATFGDPNGGISPETSTCDVVGTLPASGCGDGGGKGAAVGTSDRISGAGVLAHSVTVPTLFPRTRRPSNKTRPGPTYLSTGPSGDGVNGSVPAPAPACHVGAPIASATAAGAVAALPFRQEGAPPTSPSFGQTVVVAAVPFHSPHLAVPTAIDQPTACAPKGQAGAGPYASHAVTMLPTADVGAGATTFQTIRRVNRSEAGYSVCATGNDGARVYDASKTRPECLHATFAVGAPVFSVETLDAPFNTRSLSDTDLPDINIDIDLDAAPSPVPTSPIFTAAVDTAAGLPFGISASAAAAASTPAGADGSVYIGAAASSPVGINNAIAGLAACLVTTDTIGSRSHSNSHSQAPILAPFPIRTSMPARCSTAEPTPPARDASPTIYNWDNPPVGDPSAAFPPVSRPPITTGAVVRTRAREYVPLPYAGGAGGNGDHTVGISSYTTWSSSL